MTGLKRGSGAPAGKKRGSVWLTPSRQKGSVTGKLQVDRWQCKHGLIGYAYESGS